MEAAAADRTGSRTPGLGVRTPAIMSLQRVRVATYNVHKCRGLDRQTLPERIAEVIKELDADVVAIQEILDVRDGRKEFDQARRICRALPQYQHCFGENRVLHGGPYGNMTLSRAPIELCRNYDVTWKHKERRGCLRTDVTAGGSSLLHIFNVHLWKRFVGRRHPARVIVGGEGVSRPNFIGPPIVV